MFEANLETKAFVVCVLASSEDEVELGGKRLEKLKEGIVSGTNTLELMRAVACPERFLVGVQALSSKVEAGGKWGRLASLRRCSQRQDHVGVFGGGVNINNDRCVSACRLGSRLGSRLRVHEARTGERKAIID